MVVVCTVMVESSFNTRPSKESCSDSRSLQTQLIQDSVSY